MYFVLGNVEGCIPVKSLKLSSHFKFGRDVITYFEVLKGQNACGSQFVGDMRTGTDTWLRHIMTSGTNWR